METFPPTYFIYSTRYPESGQRIQLGNSYQFDTPPAAPDQRIFRLTLQGMCYFVDQNNEIDEVYQPGRNLAVLDKFYNDHKRAHAFIFPHPVYGNVICKFNTPLEIPPGVPGGNGLVQDPEVELIEIPQ
jgi:hypothetical protein